MPKETILVSGGVGSGKSTWVLQMIHDHVPSNQPIWVIEGERKIRGAATLFGGFPKNVKGVYNPLTIKEASQIVNEEIIPVVRGKPEGYGIVVVDMLNLFWEKAQADFHEVLSQDTDIAEYMQMKMEDRKSKGQSQTAANMFEGFTEWPIVKAMHNKNFLDILLQDIPSHIIATATSREIRTDAGNMNDKPDRAAMWAQAGELPEGEKYSDSKFITCMALQRLGLIDPQHRIWMTKDRSRTLGKIGAYFSDVLCSPDEESGIFDLWIEATSLRLGLPLELEADKK